MNNSLYQNTAFIYAKDINLICNRLFLTLGINAFSYSRVYQDGSRSELWSDVSALEHSFFEKRYISKIYTPDLLKNKDFLLYDITIQSFPEPLKKQLMKQLDDQRRLFNHDNCLFLIDCKQDYTEYCIFYTPTNHYNAVNDYINNTEHLRQFRRFFRNSAKKIINKADQNRLIKPWRNTLNNTSSITPMLTNDNTFVPHFTNREEDVATLLMKGMTAKSIASELYISRRTAEKHIENLKEKTNCSRKGELIGYLIKRCFNYENA